MELRTKSVFRSIGGIGSILGIITGVIGWYDALPTDLISDTHLFLVSTVTALIALFGRWKAVLPLHLFRRKG